jgi:aminopeptidase N
VDQSGCITFVDHSNQFVYTDFEPYGCNRVFPCFDQPNLKAIFRLSVVSPTKWIVTSNVPVIEEQPLSTEHFARMVDFEHAPSSEMLHTFLNKAEAGTKVTSFGQT